jgi:hypothetical protein
MKEIKLTQGKVALVDDGDYDRLTQHKWCARKAHNTYYARRASREKPGPFYIIMHREIKCAPHGLEIDHIDGDGLNNQKENLRLCVHKENLWNARPHSGGVSSKFKGVHWCKTRERWIAKIYINGQNHYIGAFVSEEEAAKRRDTVAVKGCGEFARLNFKHIGGDYGRSVALP